MLSQMMQIVGQLPRVAIFYLLLLLLFVSLWLLVFASALYAGVYGMKLSFYLRKKGLPRGRAFLTEPRQLFRKFFRLRDPNVLYQFNPFEVIKKRWNYLFNDQDTRDPKILSYKKKLRRAAKVFVCAFLSLVALLVVFLLAYLVLGPVSAEIKIA